MTEGKIVGWHHWLNGHEFEQTLEDGEGQESPVGCSPWVHKSRTQLSDWKSRKQHPLLLVSISENIRKYSQKAEW